VKQAIRCRAVLLAPLVMALGLWAGSSGLPAEEAISSTVVKIALVSTITRGVPAAFTEMIVSPFKALMEAETGLSGEVVTGRDPMALARDLLDDKVQIGVFHGHEYAWAKQKFPKLAVVALCVNRTQHIKLHLVVRTDSAAQSFADLKGKIISVPRMGREQCLLYLERRCVPPGTRPEAFYRHVSRPIATADSLNEVVEREAAAAIVDAAGLEDYRKSNGALGRRLRSLAISEPFPAGVIAYCPGRFSEEKVAKFRAGLLAAKTTAVGRSTLKRLRLTSFEAPSEDHDALLAAIARAYPPPATAK
jgi:ABC-type phosphate/phosphonate transport system substrate-binding protein